jgi:hypothetical protein
MADSLQEVGRGYVICFVLGPGILETLLQHCVAAIYVPVQTTSNFLKTVSHLHGVPDM